VQEIENTKVIYTAIIKTTVTYLSLRMPQLRLFVVKAVQRIASTDRRKPSESSQQVPTGSGDSEPAHNIGRRRSVSGTRLQLKAFVIARMSVGVRGLCVFM
jgi:hypothetical protein